MSAATGRPRHPLGRDCRGATILEFALIAPVFFMMLFALFDLGYQMYVESVIEGTLHRAARRASIGNTSISTIDAYVRQQLQAFTTTRVDIDKKSYYQFSGVDRAEADADGDGICEPGETFIDENRNGTFDTAAQSGSTGFGNSDDIVFYTVTVRYKRLFPLAAFLGWSPDVIASANTVLRNQPYGAQSGLPTPTPCP